ALPEAIGLLRSTRKQEPAHELIVLSGADPLNLLGIVTPGPRIAALAANRVLFKDGTPIAALESDAIRRLADNAVPDATVESSLRTGRLPVSLRAYYR
ncbi:MAG TPA: hypothetical protein VL970_00485, partial [Candidatus Acidoferrales bacterium]|nr:hypothetical protein [Candidatus Acidoferrales bacterium]